MEESAKWNAAYAACICKAIEARGIYFLDSTNDALGGWGIGRLTKELLNVLHHAEATSKGKSAEEQNDISAVIKKVTNIINTPLAFLNSHYRRSGLYKKAASFHQFYNDRLDVAYEVTHLDYLMGGDSLPNKTSALLNYMPEEPTDEIIPTEFTPPHVIDDSWRDDALNRLVYPPGTFICGWSNTLASIGHVVSRQFESRKRSFREFRSSYKVMNQILNPAQWQRASEAGMVGGVDLPNTFLKWIISTLGEARFSLTGVDPKQIQSLFEGKPSFMRVGKCLDFILDRKDSLVRNENARKMVSIKESADEKPILVMTLKEIFEIVYKKELRERTDGNSSPPSIDAMREIVAKARQADSTLPCYAIPPNNDTICYFEPMVVYEILSSHHCHKPKIIDKNEFLNLTKGKGVKLANAKNHLWSNLKRKKGKQPLGKRK